MKLRNKKTGEIFEGGFILIPTSVGIVGNAAKSVAEVNEIWEDYDPEVPLIKDEKIRKAVRVWADANDIRFGRRCGSLNAYSKRIVGWNAVGTTFTIEFDKDLKMYGDSITKDDYTIAELCGEEEE